MGHLCTGTLRHGYTTNYRFPSLCRVLLLGAGFLDCSEALPVSFCRFAFGISSESSGGGRFGGGIPLNRIFSGERPPSSAFSVSQFREARGCNPGSSTQSSIRCFFAPARFFPLPLLFPLPLPSPSSSFAPSASNFSCAGPWIATTRRRL